MISLNFLIVGVQCVGKKQKFSKISKDYQITFDNRINNCFIVHGENNKLKFIRSQKGLYFYDTRKPKNALQMVQTVKENEDAFTKRQVQQARLARQIYTLLGRPSQDDFVKFVRSNSLKNCPIDVDDANRSIRIYGPDIPALHGKTVRTQPNHVVVPEISPVPEHILTDSNRRLPPRHPAGIDCEIAKTSY